MRIFSLKVICAVFFISVTSSLLASPEPAPSHAPSFFTEVKLFFKRAFNWITCSQDTCPVETPEEQKTTWNHYVATEEETLKEESDI